MGAIGKGFLDGHESKEILILASNAVENLSTLSKLNPPGSQHKREVSALEHVVSCEKIKMNISNSGTGKVMTKMTDDTEMRSQLFTTHLKWLSGHTKKLKLILVCCRSKVTTDKDIQIIREQVDGFGHLSITHFLPNNAWITTNNVPKLGAM